MLQNGNRASLIGSVRTLNKSAVTEKVICLFMCSGGFLGSNHLFLSTDRVCHQQGLSLWVPFQNSATALTNLYKGIETHFSLSIF